MYRSRNNPNKILVEQCWNDRQFNLQRKITNEHLFSAELQNGEGMRFVMHEKRIFAFREKDKNTFLLLEPEEGTGKLSRRTLYLPEHIEASKFELLNKSGECKILTQSHGSYTIMIYVSLTGRLFVLRFNMSDLFSETKNILCDILDIGETPRIHNMILYAPLSWYVLARGGDAFSYLDGKSCKQVQILDSEDPAARGMARRFLEVSKEKKSYEIYDLVL
jgi:hypothetical protein